MSGWVIIAVVAILVWGVIRMSKIRQGIVTDERGNETFRDASADREALLEAERERDELRERVQVLERIVTDANMPAAQKTKQIEAEIENLREELPESSTRKSEELSK